MSLTKPSGIQGLDSEHPLNGNISQFYEFGQTNKELVSDTAFTHSGTDSSDGDLGDSVLFNELNAGVSATLSVSNNNTILVIHKNAGSDAGHAGDIGVRRFVYNETGGNCISLLYSPFSGHRYESKLRANFSSYSTSRIDPFDNPGYSQPHALAWSFNVTATTDFRRIYFDGALEAETLSEASPGQNFASAPVSCSMADDFGSDGDTYISAIVCFNKRLSDAEMASVTTDPWAMVSTGAPADTTPPVYEVAPAVAETRENGHTISGTADEDSVFYGVRLPAGATVPTSQQVIDGQDASGSPALEADSVVASAGISADLDFVTASAGTGYRYAIVAVDDEPTPNVQATPTVIDDTTAAAVVEGISAQTIRDKAGNLTPNATNLKIAVRESSDPESTVHFSTTNGSLNGSSQTSAINLESAGVTVGDTVHFSYFNPALNEGLNVDLTVEDIA